MERLELDRFAMHYQLKADAVQRLLVDTHAWPTRLQWQQFGVRVLRGVGVVSLSAAIIFWIAANWQNFGAMIKFFALDALLIICIGLACWRPPMHVIGCSALTIAFVLTGALLALFGITYQTGANTYELFFGWAALGMPLVILARTLSAWVLWWVVLVVAMVLYAPAHFGLVFGFWSLESDLLNLHWLVPGVISLAMAALFAVAPDRLVPLNVRARMSVIAIASAITFATLEGVNLVHRGPIVLFVVHTAVYLAFAYWAHQKRGLAVLAMLATSWIVLSTVWLVKLVPNFDVVGSLLTGIWILLSASIAVTVLTRWHRAWGKQS
jgi:uncharacterized membrane protein